MIIIGMTLRKWQNHRIFGVHFSFSVGFSSPSLDIVAHKGYCSNLLRYISFHITLDNEIRNIPLQQNKQFTSWQKLIQLLEIKNTSKKRTAYKLIKIHKWILPLSHLVPVRLVMNSADRRFNTASILNSKNKAH